MLCNLLTTILRPNFEEPLDTFKQLVEKNITLFARPGNTMWKQFLLESPILENRLLGETMIIPDIEDSAESHYDPASHFKNLTKHGVFGAGTHAQLTGYLASYQLRDYGPWYRSKETLAGKNPYSGYLTNKKWHLNEVNINEMFVNLLSSSWPWP